MTSKLGYLRTGLATLCRYPGSSRLSSAPGPGRAVFSAPIHAHLFRSNAYEAGYDQVELAEARKWYASLSESQLPKGQTSYSRSSGPGGQHVNKTESKATTVWTIKELESAVPKLLRPALRTSRYYTQRGDSFTVQAQTQRSRTANTDENLGKLVEELRKMYQERVPGETSDEKVKKHEKQEKAFREGRLKAKKQHSAKKASRKGSNDY